MADAMHQNSDVEIAFASDDIISTLFYVSAFNSGVFQWIRESSTTAKRFKHFVKICGILMARLLSPLV